MAENPRTETTESAIPSVIAHRGASGTAPENTLAAMRKASELGARWVEFDVMLCADGVPILMHDDDLSRTTNGTGPVADMPLAEIRKLDAGGWFGAGFAGERVPTVRQAVALLAELGLGANIEIKPAPGQDAATARAAMDVVANEWPPSLPVPLISSFSLRALEAARDMAPEIPRALLISRIPRDWRQRLDALDCRALHVNQRHLTKNRAGRLIAADATLRCYTVNDPARAAELFAWGVHGIISDYPERLIGL